jgi:hypothetical protein
MTSLSTPRLSGILLSAVSATLALSACGGVVSDPDEAQVTGQVRNAPVKPNEIPTMSPVELIDPEVVPEPPTVDGDECIPFDATTVVPSRAAGLDPTEPVAYVGVFDFTYSGVVNGEEIYVMSATESAGTPCSGAADLASCRVDFAELTRSDRGFGEAFWTRFIITDKDGAREISSVAEMEVFLGTINTFNEAALILSLRGIWTDCSQLSKVGDDYVTEVIRTVGCEALAERNELTLGPDGTTEEVLIETIPSGCVEGRLTDGVCLDSSDPHAAKDLGLYLSGVCQLETAAVAAFMQLADELKRHNAPEALVRGARHAAYEEIEHAQATHSLASRFGGSPRPVDFRPRLHRSLLEIAMENAREGCVRELFGAACAHLQAKQARDPEIKKTFARIAEEETGHAEWSLALDLWLRDRLSEAEWTQVEQARNDAVVGLYASTRLEPAAILVEQAGVPTSAQVKYLLSELSPLFG